MCKKLTCLVAFFVLLGAVSPDLGADPDPSLTGWWTFDGHALDISGNDRHGTIHGSPQYVPGVFGEALEFQANPDYLTIDGYKGILGTNPFSITAWVRTTNTAIEQIVHWGAQVNEQRVEFRINSNRLRISHGAGNVQGETDLTDGEWYHVAVSVIENATASSGDVTFYVNGEDDTMVSSDPERWNIVANPTLDVTIGWRPTQQDRPFIGTIDDIRIYDTVLTQEEVQQIMLGGGEPYPFASSPDPADGASVEDTWVSLSWSPGALAVSHDVYLGDNFDEVNDGTPGAPGFRGNQTATTLVAGFPGFPYPDGLVPGTTYYWRIDEVNEAEPNSPWKGKIWSFSVPPRTAYNPDPPDGAELVDPNAELSWTPGFAAKLHTVYVGTDFDDVNNAAGGIPSGFASHSPGPLELEKVYYWRVDEFDAVDTYKGDVWSFTTPGAAGSLQPANGATDVQINSTLNWTPATNAVSHDLYFGTDRDAVKNATIASPQFKGNMAAGSETYDPGKLAWHSDHYWRVDAVYGTGTVKGLVWGFTTADFLLVDDFESYNDIDPPDPNSNRIFESWIDGFGTTDNGALVGNDLPPYAEQTIVHGGVQSMPYSYDNNLKTSEATMTLVSPRDWTAEGVTKLSLWFRGSATNAAERMYVALNGSAVVYHDAAAATQTGRWTEWVIDLQAFADQGVNLANVDTITIGIGTRNSPAAGGPGTMYFDDIRLYQ
ncbi:MAG: LamG domain-containing protein [Planctomycetota bacterium]